MRFLRRICFKGYHHRPGILLSRFHSDDTKMPQVRNESTFICQPIPNTGYHSQHTLFCLLFIISPQRILSPFHRLASGSTRFLLLHCPYISRAKHHAVLSYGESISGPAILHHDARWVSRVGCRCEPGSHSYTKIASNQLARHGSDFEPYKSISLNSD